MKKLFVLLLAGVLLQSCGSLLPATHTVELFSVESPANAKQQFGETKVVSFKDEDLNKYHYEDDYIDIVWYVTSKKFNFLLKNKSGHTIKINWDDVSYVDINGITGRVMHSGVKYSERNNSQPATTIPKNASISDLLLPTDNVYYLGTYGGWMEKKLFNFSEDKIGKKMYILMPIMIENVQNDYTFEFRIDKISDEE